MFESEPWEDFEGPKLSALTYAQVQSTSSGIVENGKENEKNLVNEQKKMNTQKKKKKKNLDIAHPKSSVKNVSKLVRDATTTEMSKISSGIKSQDRAMMQTADKLMNSPGATRLLMDDSEDDTPNFKVVNKRKMERKGSDSSLKNKFTSAKGLFVEAGEKLQRAMTSSVFSVKETIEKNDYDQMEKKTQMEEKTNTNNILTKGIKFASQDAFMKFMNQTTKKNKRAKKRKNDDAEELSGSDNCGYQKTPKKSNAETQEDQVTEENSDPVAEEIPPVPMPREKNKKRKDDVEKMEEITTNATSSFSPSGIDLNKLRLVLSHNETTTSSATKPAEATTPTRGKKSIGDKAKEKLSAARFRYLNEQLYTQPASQSYKTFSKDEKLFRVYHSGYQQQAGHWPIDPLNVIIASCLKLPETHEIADMGCGEARLARSVPNTVHSFDLVSLNSAVTACDMSHTPLEEGQVNVVVFCLSLMGTNVKDFLFEAGRVLKVGGTMKVAELESRFQDGYSAEQFISDVCKFGFKNTWKDLRKEYFYFMDFEKIGDVKKKKKLPEITLKPCLYKKR